MQESKLKRDEIKYIRDLAKGAYKKAASCYICTSTNTLEFHHYYTMTLLWAKWKLKNKVFIKQVDDIKYQREQFIGEHSKEIYTDTVTLCKVCHKDKLHKIYGKAPTLGTAEKQKRWVEKQKTKYIESQEK